MFSQVDTMFLCYFLYSIMYKGVNPEMDVDEFWEHFNPIYEDLIELFYTQAIEERA